METRSLLQPLLRSVTTTTTTTSNPLFSSSSSTWFAAAATTPASRRHQSSSARTKRALKIPPHPSFLQNPLEAARVIYNPPASAPSVYHTPFKFLPPSDPRRKANLAQVIRASAAAPTTPLPPPTANPNLAPELKTPPQFYNVTREQVEEMRQLRAEDPEKWSVHELARRYSCAPIFVMMCCRADREHRDREKARLDAVKARWGPIRSHAREERKKRKILLHQDAL
ncbi:mitochondrial ribosomal protein subunit L20-domain-containing protein [Hypoxylon fragiforme]|uniref:mitochondrial ribosomal protein subunit L20-domain-containing protein n=1 Tax=Hypoxylon fragiforme TaxID=63214 RepID=UPI0020C61E3E|nr:mitochondrial ribosomal protein subunit L20-domain-containing protein [Hypoxylon fragiforme]KAI2606113.1 mitochondrial ribosomal protein subunit L20-domain-containing protein [Hypoxylon fragiforme]